VDPKVEALGEILGGWRVVSSMFPTLFPHAKKNVVARFLI